MQLEVGIGTPVLEAPFKKYSFLVTYGWFKELWHFVSNEEIVLCQENLVIPPLQCEGDEFIKEKLIQVCNWDQADICQI